MPKLYKSQDLKKSWFFSTFGCLLSVSPDQMVNMLNTQLYLECIRNSPNWRLSWSLFSSHTLIHKEKYCECERSYWFEKHYNNKKGNLISKEIIYASRIAQNHIKYTIFPYLRYLYVSLMQEYCLTRAELQTKQNKE